MSCHLQDGAKLKSVHWRDGGAATTDDKYTVSITVSHEPGQMGMVPWALVELTDGNRMLINLANVDCVVLAAEEMK